MLNLWCRAAKNDIQLQQLNQGFALYETQETQIIAFFPGCPLWVVEC